MLCNCDFRFEINIEKNNLRIIQINNYGYIRGGSDRYYIDLGKLLSERGHDVAYLTSANERNIVDSSYAVYGFNIESPSVFDIPSFIYSLDTQKKLRRLIEKIKPDIAHLHIYYGQITPSIFPVLKEYNIPIVQTLHEYKLICPVSTMMRNGRLCEECINDGNWKSAWHRCNRGKFMRSIVTASESYIANLVGAKKVVDHYIAVSNFVRLKMIEHGMPEMKITTASNFVLDDIFSDNNIEGKYFLYVGRVEKIKGIGTLIRAMASVPHVNLYIVGTGEAKSELEQEAIRLGLANVKFLGFKSGQELRNLIAGAICIINPSECYETFGLILLESFAQSRPVIASRMGGMTELVDDGVDGLLFDAGNKDQLSEALSWMASHRQLAVEMGKEGQKKAQQHYSASKHYADVMNIYRKVIAR